MEKFSVKIKQVKIPFQLSQIPKTLAILKIFDESSSNLFSKCCFLLQIFYFISEIFAS